MRVVQASFQAIATFTVVILGAMIVDFTKSANAQITVGPGKNYEKPSEAAAVAQDGDIIEIDAGIYDGDVTIWTQNNLIIRGVNGRAHLRANGNHAQGKGIWVIKGDSTTVENI